ncbi:MAG: GNAT family N-acetyltransferase [Treponema sp.]|nr:GNAT family N-acetyltransferase [Treponema sp.]
MSEAKRPGSGAGTFFLGEIEKTVKKLGITTMFLLTDSNVPAFHFYKKNGFVQEETNVAFFKCLED